MRAAVFAAQLLALLFFSVPSSLLLVKASRLCSSAKRTCGFQNFVRGSASPSPGPRGNEGEEAWRGRPVEFRVDAKLSSHSALRGSRGSAGDVPKLRVGSRWSPLAIAQTKLLLRDLARAWPHDFPVAAQELLKDEETETDDRVGGGVEIIQEALLTAPAGPLSEERLRLLSKREALRFGEFEVVPFQSKGDILQFKTPEEQLEILATEEAGGKGLFTKELGAALLGGSVDFVVHSLKDLPAQLSNTSVLGAVLSRGDVRDVLVLPSERLLSEEESKALALRALEDVLTRGSEAPAPAASQQGLTIKQGTLRFGSASLRRQSLVAALLRRRLSGTKGDTATDGKVDEGPILTFNTLRGNVQTRLRKLQERLVDATLLAAAGLKRLGLVIGEGPNARATLQFPSQELRLAFLDPSIFTPAVGQGIVVAECLKSNTKVRSFLEGIHDSATFLAATAERAFLASLDGSCRTPIGGFAEFTSKLSQTGLCFRGFVASPDGCVLERVYASTETVSSSVEAESLGRGAGEELRARVGDSFLKSVQAQVVAGWATMKSTA